ncbi:MAG: hypothetical protein EHM35_19580 [Planctomycetaceae bacterium]|nr:MAG: hypothetical protein EHM35_19580 [Planctomycetaceae bacterium]
MTRICIDVDGGTTTPQPTVRTYETLVGDGSQVDYLIDHNLNSQSVFVNAYDANTGDVLGDYSLTLVNANRLRIHFDTIPAFNSVKVQVVAVIPVPMP